jgi:hypothetical protein
MLVTLRQLLPSAGRSAGSCAVICHGNATAALARQQAQRSFSSERTVAITGSSGIIGSRIRGGELAPPVCQMLLSLPLRRLAWRAFTRPCLFCVRLLAVLVADAALLEDGWKVRGVANPSKLSQGGPGIDRQRCATLFAHAACGGLRCAADLVPCVGGDTGCWR